MTINLKQIFRFLRLWFKRLLLVGLVLLLIVILGNLWVIGSTSHLLYNDIDKIPMNNVGLVLGTSNKTPSGRTNYFFKRRVEAAADLYKKNKVKHLIVSGDNSLHSYNEPREMYRALVKLGVPDTCITLDFAGFRTLDSVVRSKKVFQQEKITIISQKYHNYRAAYLAKQHDIEAVAFNTAKVGAIRKRTFIREYFARLKAILDVHVLRMEPKFLGEKIDIAL